MEDSKKIQKFFGRPGEEYYLWAARTKAALAGKGLQYLVGIDVLGGDEAPGEEVQKKIFIPRAISIQVFGDRPLRICLSVENIPFKMWKKLKDRYAVSNTATQVQLQTKLSRMSYKEQALQDYFDAYEAIFNRQAAMKSDVAEDLQVVMLLASFGDKSRSLFGHSISTLQSIQDNLD